MNLEANHHGFFLDGKPFYPRILDEEVIVLSARPGDELNWEKEKQRAVGKESLFWQIDLGLETGALALKDQAIFHTLAIALEQFTKEIWPLFKEKTLGVSLYRGPFNIDARLIWDAEMEEDAPSDHQRIFFGAEIFAKFIHRLISFLPTELAVFCFFTVEDMSDALAALLFSRERFEHVHLGIDGCRLPFRGLTRTQHGWMRGEAEEAEVGVVIPPDALCTSDVLNELDELLSFLKGGAPFRMIPEAFMTEEWDGLEKLYVVPGGVSAQGRRMLKGFEVTGGTTLELEKNRSRGI